jgi:hypothetical protein
LRPWHPAPESLLGSTGENLPWLVITPDGADMNLPHQGVARPINLGILSSRPTIARAVHILALLVGMSALEIVAACGLVRSSGIIVPTGVSAPGVVWRLYACEPHGQPALCSSLHPGTAPIVIKTGLLGKGSTRITIGPGRYQVLLDPTGCPFALVTVRPHHFSTAPISNCSRDLP